MIDKRERKRFLKERPVVSNGDTAASRVGPNGSSGIINNDIALLFFLIFFFVLHVKQTRKRDKIFFFLCVCCVFFAKGRETMA